MMHYRNDPELEQMIWLVWELQGNKAVLTVICTTDDILHRYVTDDHKFLHGSVTPVVCEKVMCDHRFGHGDRSAAIAVNLIRRS